MPHDVLLSVLNHLPPGSAAALHAAKASPLIARLLAPSLRAIHPDTPAADIAESLSGGVGLSVQALTLAFPATSFDSDTLAAIATECPNLRFVAFASLQLEDGLNDASFVRFIQALSVNSHCPLEELRIEFCGGISGNSLVFAASVLPALKRITFKFAGYIGDHHIVKVCEYVASRLVELDVECSPCIGDKSLEAIAAYCPNTALLGIAGCHEVSDDGLQIVAASLGPSLRALDLHDAPNVTDLGIYHIACHCPNLEYLNVWRVCLTSFAICAVAETSGKSLQILVMGDCIGIDDEAILSVLENCCVLEELEMPGLNKITDSMMLQLLDQHHGPPLTSINFDRCRLITDATLLAAARNANLTEVSAVTLPAVTKQCIDFVNQERPDMRLRADDVPLIPIGCDVALNAAYHGGNDARISSKGTSLSVVLIP